MDDLKTHIKATQGFLDKSDGRDKLLAAVQYAAMFIAAGSPGDAKKVQASVAAARKVFRVMRPLESLAPLVHNPALNPSKPLAIEILNKLKPVLMAVYFAGDNVVWASQAGLLTDKTVVTRAQKSSLYGWFGGSLCTIVSEIYEIQAMTARRTGESAADYAARQVAIDPEVRRRTTVLIHACFQALLAVGLLELRPWKPRTVGALGIIASVMNCYMLWPAVPKPWFSFWSGRQKAAVVVPVPQVPAPLPPDAVAVSRPKAA